MSSTTIETNSVIPSEALGAERPSTPGVVAAEVEPDRRIRIEYDRKRIQKAELRGVLALLGVHLDD